jgi:hypothetical protein
MGFCRPEIAALRGLIDRLGGVLLHSGNDVAVQVQGDPDSAMPKALAGNLGVDAIGKQMCGVGVP